MNCKHSAGWFAIKIEWHKKLISNKNIIIVGKEYEKTYGLYVGLVSVWWFPDIWWWSWLTAVYVANQGWNQRRTETLAPSVVKLHLILSISNMLCPLWTDLHPLCFSCKQKSGYTTYNVFFLLYFWLQVCPDEVIHADQAAVCACIYLFFRCLCSHSTRRNCR